MTDKPIIFSAPMVRALLAGRKTQTRRLLKGQWHRELEGHDRVKTWFAPPDVPKEGVPNQWAQSGIWAEKHGEDGYNRHLGFTAYRPGDRLYVREAWRVGAWRAEHWARGDGECDADIAIDYLADEFARREWLHGDDPQMMLRLMNQSREDASQASQIDPDAAGIFHWEPGASPCRIRPPIHMPRWASRLTLIVTDVRVQRLQDISEADAVAEGVFHRSSDFYPQGVWTHGGDEGWHNAEAAYRHLWNSLHGPDAWDANPWVVAISFTVHKGNIDKVANA